MCLRACLVWTPCPKIQGQLNTSTIIVVPLKDIASMSFRLEKKTDLASHACLSSGARICSQGPDIAGRPSILSNFADRGWDRKKACTDGDGRSETNEKGPVLISDCTLPFPAQRRWLPSTHWVSPASVSMSGPTLVMSHLRLAPIPKPPT